MDDDEDSEAVYAGFQHCVVMGTWIMEGEKQVQEESRLDGGA